MKDFIKKSYNIASLILKVAKYPRGARVPDKYKGKKKCLAVGNGPSLALDLKELIPVIDGFDVFCVGEMANTDEYISIKPKYYIIWDPALWSADAPEESIIRRSILFNNIVQRTDWPMVVIAPVQAVNLKYIFLDNEWLSICLVNNTPSWAPDRISHWFYDRGFAVVPAHNVLVATLFISLRMGYDETAIIGADHSWHENIKLDEYNRLCVRDAHFYDSDAPCKPFSIDGSSSNIYRIDQFFLALSYMFYGYHKIQSYASYLGLRVLNLSGITYIDAFDRCAIKDYVDDEL